VKPHLASAELSSLIARLGIDQNPSGERELAPGEWSLDALSGRFAELSSAGETASISAAASIILEAQQRGEPAAWIAAGPSTFFPPDMAALGIDLESFPLIRVGKTIFAAKAADWLLRSGAFAVVILDLGTDWEIPLFAQARLAALAKKNRTTLLCLTKKQRDMPSIGSLVSIRAEARTRRAGFDKFTWEIHILKDKRKGPGWSVEGESRGVEGLC